MATLRCDHENSHKGLYHINDRPIKYAYCPSSKDKIDPEPKKCWIDDSFGELFSEGVEFKCLFHASEASIRTKHPSKDIYQDRSVFLYCCLDKWNQENELRKSSRQPILSFLLADTSIGEFSLPNRSFSGEFRIDNVDFEKEADFRYSNFEGYARFEKVKFKGETYFAACNFNNDVMFKDVSFHEVTHIEFTKFLWNGLFIDTRFLKELCFERCFLESGLRFLRCTFNSLKYVVHNKGEIVFNQCETIDNLSFKDQDCSRLLFLDMDLDKVDFLGADVSQTRFEACRWKKPDKAPLYAKVYKHEEYFGCQDNGAGEKQKKEYKNSQKLETLPKEVRFTDSLKSRIAYASSEKLLIFTGVMTSEEKEQLLTLASDFEYKKAIEELFQKSHRLFKLKSLYRQLMKNLEDSRDIKQAGDFHYRDMELREKMIANGMIQPESRVELWLLKRYRWFADYGESYTWLGVWTLAFWLLIFPAIVLGVESVGNGIEHDFGNIVFSWKYSGDVWKAVVFGIVPTGLQRTVDCVLGGMNFVSKGIITFATFVLLTLAALFVMAVNRRFRR